MASLRRVVVASLGSMRAAHSRRGLAAWHTRSQPMRNSVRCFTSTVPLNLRLLRDQGRRAQPRFVARCPSSAFSGIVGTPRRHARVLCTARAPSRNAAPTSRSHALSAPPGARACSNTAVDARPVPTGTTAPTRPAGGTQPGQRRGRAAVESAEAQARGKSTQHVRSFFVAASIDVDDLLRRLPSHWLRKTGKNSAMLTLKAADRTVPDAAAQGNTIPWEDSHVSVFQRGAMVFLNCDFPTYLEVFNLVKKANHSAVRPEYGEGATRAQRCAARGTWLTVLRPPPARLHGGGESRVPGVVGAGGGGAARSGVGLGQHRGAQQRDGAGRQWAWRRVASGGFVCLAILTAVRRDTSSRHRLLFWTTTSDRYVVAVCLCCRLHHITRRRTPLQVDSMLDTVQELNRAIENKDTSKLKADHLYNALTRVNDISIQVIMSGLRNK